MTERPILFSGPMPRAILDWRKTQTRRRLKNLPSDVVSITQTDVPGVWYVDCETSECGDIVCPYGKPGDRLWVREAWGVSDTNGDDALVVLYKASNDVRPNGVSAEDFGASRRIVVGLDQCERYAADADHDNDFRWRPSIFMPRWASRITLEITEVRVERLAEISDLDAIADAGLSQHQNGAWTEVARRWGAARRWLSCVSGTQYTGTVHLSGLRGFG